MPKKSPPGRTDGVRRYPVATFRLSPETFAALDRLVQSIQDGTRVGIIRRLIHAADERREKKEKSG